MRAITPDEVRSMMNDVLTKQGKALPSDDTVSLDEIGFRSLDFSELALRVEDEVGKELNFDAPGLREIRTVGDVLGFIDELLNES